MKKIDKVLFGRYGNKIITTWETAGGLLAVKHKRGSKKFPVGIDYLGPRGGFKGFQLIRTDGSKTSIDWEK